MKTFLPWFLFTLSGAFNAFFVAGTATGPTEPMERHGPEDRTEFFARKLELDEDQRYAFLVVEKRFMEEREKRGREHRERFDKVLAELAKDEPDEAVLKEFMDDDEAMNPKKHFVEHVRAIMKILDPEQRMEAAGMFRRGPGMGRGRGMGGPPGGKPRGGGRGGPPGRAWGPGE